MVAYGLPADKIFYKVLAMTELPNIEAHGTLPLQTTGSEQWKIGLRESLDDAVVREAQISGSVSKHTHLVLEITFTPLGLAHYAQICKGPDYSFQPVLQKMMYRGPQDWKVWHFHGDLPLQAQDEEGNVLIRSRLMEIL